MKRLVNKLRFSDIKVGHIYYADLNPVKQYEFGDNHLCIVLEKCLDKRSVVIISLTSKSSGVGGNKEKLGVVQELPKRLTEKKGNPVNTYIVFDQVRTVVCNRLQYIYDGKDENGNNKLVEVPVGAAIYKNIISQLADLKVKNLSVEEQARYHKNKLFDLTLDMLLENIFSVIKGNLVINDVHQKINEAYTLLSNIKPGFSINMHVKEPHKNEVQQVLDEVLGRKPVSLDV